MVRDILGELLKGQYSGKLIDINIDKNYWTDKYKLKEPSDDRWSQVRDRFWAEVGRAKDYNLMQIDLALVPLGIYNHLEFSKLLESPDFCRYVLEPQSSYLDKLKTCEKKTLDYIDSVLDLDPSACETEKGMLGLHNLKFKVVKNLEDRLLGQSKIIIENRGNSQRNELIDATSDVDAIADKMREIENKLKEYNTGDSAKLPHEMSQKSLEMIMPGININVNELIKPMGAEKDKAKDSSAGVNEWYAAKKKNVKEINKGKKQVVEIIDANEKATIIKDKY